MTVLQSILLGLLQGLTEFLPVSSSAHLILAQKLFGIEEPELLFSVLIHLGTLLAVFAAFRKQINGLIREVFCTGKDLLTGNFSVKRASPHRKTLLGLLVSLIPLLLIYPIKNILDPLLISPLVAGICLLFNALVLILCDTVRNSTKTAETMTWKDALFVGLVQCVAILPGLSRSGATVTAGVCRGFDRSYAAQYSFLLSIPTILGGAVLELADALSMGIDPQKIPVYLVGTATAALSGFGAIRLLEWLLKSKRFVYFAFYSFAVGIAAILWTVLI